MRFLCAAVLALLPPAAASAASDEAPSRDCFLSSNWQGWSVTPEADALYLRIRPNEIFRVQLTPGSHVHRYPGEFLVNRIRGSSWICSPLDLDLAISDTNGFSRPLIATGLTKLTPEEAAAIASEDRPY
jgi:hypothetical protein